MAKKTWFFRRVDKVIAGVTEGYRRALRGFLRFRLVAVVLFFAALGLTYLIFQRVPKGFVPNEDQGYFIIALQSPSGASLEYTKRITQQVQGILQDIPEVEGIFAVSGFSFSRERPKPGPGLCPAEAVFPTQGRRNTPQKPW